MRCVGKYNERLTIESLKGTADAHGHIDNTSNDNWKTYTSSYATVMTRGGREFWKVDQQAADVTHVWRCPYGKALAAATPDMRLKHEGLFYEIVSVVDLDMKHEEIEIQTRLAIQGTD